MRNTLSTPLLIGFYLITIFTISACGISLQNISIENNVPKINNINIGSMPNKLTQEEAGNGLKDALNKGVNTGAQNLMKIGGFANNQIYKILLPEEVRSLEQKIRSNPLLNAAIGHELDKSIAAMNAGAESAISQAMPIFGNAISQITFGDAIKILTGGQGAATTYLNNQTSEQLNIAFQPEIKKALENLTIYNHWNPIIKTVNSNKKLLGLTKDIQPNLEAYVTEKAISALFSEIEIQENLIRKDPIQRSTALLKKAFDFADTHQ